MKLERIKNLTKKQQLNQLKIAFILLAVISIVCAVTVYKDYSSRPGLLKEDGLKVLDKGTDFVTFGWEDVRNADKYTVTYKDANGDTKTVETDTNKVTIDGLSEGTDYSASLSVESEERKGNKTRKTKVTTKKSQKIEGKTRQFKLSASEPDLGLKAETPITYKSEEEPSKDEEELLSTPGTVTLTAEAEETDEYAGDSVEVTVDVLDSVNVEAAGASIHVLYDVDESNCELVRTISGSEGADVPQSFGYKDGEYIIAYGMYDKQRIVTFGENGKSVSRPDIKLGHPNGFTYSDATGKCYCVKGWGGRCVTYDPETDEYDVFNLPYGASGIAYDKDKELFYTASKPLMVAYDKDFNVVNTVGVINHGSSYFTQDCGGYGGIMLRCVSDKSRHGTNYVDFYDMVNGNYLGSVRCHLSEVESAVVDDEGYMELLCNTTDEKDYIWKTPINIDDIKIRSEEKHD